MSIESVFFTVVTPTMNRPALLSAAIDSVMQQTYRNFEFLVSDNSTDEYALQENRRIVAEYRSHEQFRYLRPDGFLPMPDHWEFATRHARGEFVLVLTDRFVMRPSALECLHSHIQGLPSDCALISWHANSSLGPAGRLHTLPFGEGLELRQPAEVMEEFASLSSWQQAPVWINRLPRALNSCYRADVAAKARSLYGRIFYPISPDYTSAFLLMGLSKRMAYIDRPLFVNHGGESNGDRSLMQGPAKYIASLGGAGIDTGDLENFPTITATIVSDLISMKKLSGSVWAGLEIGQVGYYLHNYREFLLMERRGAQRDIQALHAQWERAVSRLSPENQAEITRCAADLSTSRAKMIEVRRFLVRTGISPGLLEIKELTKRLLSRSAVPRYANALEAARGTDHFLTHAGPD